MFPLLKYEPSVLAVTAVVCGAHLVVKQTHKDVAMDEDLNSGLAKMCGVDVKRTLECRREVVQCINLDNLVLTNVEAQAIMAGADIENCATPCRSASIPSTHTMVLCTGRAVEEASRTVATKKERRISHPIARSPLLGSTAAGAISRHRSLRKVGGVRRGG